MILLGKENETVIFILLNRTLRCLCVLMNTKPKSVKRLCWRRDLEASRSVNDRQKAGFHMLLEWHENFRLRLELEAGREAVRSFWRHDVLGKKVRREDWSRKGLRPTRLFLGEIGL